MTLEEKNWLLRLVGDIRFEGSDKAVRCARIAMGMSPVITHLASLVVVLILLGAATNNNWPFMCGAVVALVFIYVLSMFVKKLAAKKVMIFSASIGGAVAVSFALGFYPSFFFPNGLAFWEALTWGVGLGFAGAASYYLSIVYTVVVDMIGYPFRDVFGSLMRWALNAYMRKHCPQWFDGKKALVVFGEKGVHKLDLSSFEGGIFKGPTEEGLTWEQYCSQASVLPPLHWQKLLGQRESWSSKPKWLKN